MFRTTLSSRNSRRSSQIALNWLAPFNCRKASTQTLPVWTLPKSPFFEALSKHDPSTIAIVDSGSRTKVTYGQLLQGIAHAKTDIQERGAIAHELGLSSNLSGVRIAFLAESTEGYVKTLLAALACDAIAVPLSPTFSNHELTYLLNNSGARMLLHSPRYKQKVRNLINRENAGKVEAANRSREHVQQIVIDEEYITETDPGDDHIITLNDTETSGKGGLMLYTSGTTSKPKGVLLPHSAILAQSRSLIDAWMYASRDHVLHCLPLHHIHGTINALLTPLLAGSTVEFLFPFNPRKVWERLASPYLPENQETNHASEKISFLTVVPTIYNRLLSSHKDLPSEVQQASREAISPQNMRLNISGSAALPTPTKNAWTDLSNGNVLLERYGMTEVGMALSCGLDYKDRVDGSVGWPLPAVEVRLVDTETDEVIALGEEREGEIQIRGPTVFKEYWENGQATAEEFVEDQSGGDRWFKTGDVAIRKAVDGTGQSGEEWAKGPMYFIRGRKSVDIIKSGGEKISALEIERELLSLPQIAECSVVGIESKDWGQKVAAVVVLDPDHVKTGRLGKQWGPMDMRRALKDRLANYKIPQELRIVDAIPTNAMGKINKKDLVKQLFGES